MFLLFINLFSAQLTKKCKERFCQYIANKLPRGSVLDAVIDYNKGLHSNENINKYYNPFLVI